MGVNLDTHAADQRNHRSQDTGNDPNSSAICNLARKWNLRFDGSKDPVSFLERLEELMEAYSVRRDDILKAMPELMHGAALLWYRNNKELWNSFEEFRHIFETQFFPPGYTRNLDEEIRKRTQGEQETFKNFVTSLMTLMRRRGSYTMNEKLDIIFSNMRPEYKLTVKRRTFSSLAQMLELAEEYEEYVRAKSTFRPPPSPAMALVPETAYLGRKRYDMSARSADVTEAPKRQEELIAKPRVRFVESDRTAEIKSERESRLVPHNTGTFVGNTRPPTPKSGLQRPEQTVGETPNPICWNCGNRGHLYRECERPKRLRCYYCKTEGVPTTRCGCRQGNGTRAQAKGDYLRPRVNAPQ